MPKPREQQFKVYIRRVEVFFWALVAPEMVLYWATRQWYGAKTDAEIRRLDRDTRLFHPNGRFSSVQEEKLIGVLTVERMEKFFREDRIHFPNIREDEIQDRSKGDGISKFLVIVQTSWFVAQSITRKVEGLITTELELVTLAFAVLNGAMYFLWWKKPLNVNLAVPVFLLETPVVKTSNRNTRSNGVTYTTSSLPDWTQFPNQPFKTKPAENPTLAAWRRLEVSLSSYVARSVVPYVALIGGILCWLWDGEVILEALGVLTVLAFFWTIPIFERVNDIIGGDRTQDVTEGRMRVGTFYASPITKSESTKIMIMTAIIGAIFGGIHCTGWNFVSPTYTETMLWRISSAIITGIPMAAFFTSFMKTLEESSKSNFIRNFSAVGGFLSKMVLVVGVPVYIFARISILAEAFVALLDLRPGAYALVKWTSFLPHI